MGTEGASPISRGGAIAGADASLRTGAIKRMLKRSPSSPVSRNQPESRLYAAGFLPFQNIIGARGAPLPVGESVGRSDGRTDRQTDRRTYVRRAIIRNVNHSTSGGKRSRENGFRLGRSRGKSVSPPANKMQN